MSPAVGALGAQPPQRVSPGELAGSHEEFEVLVADREGEGDAFGWQHGQYLQAGALPKVVGD